MTISSRTRRGWLRRYHDGAGPTLVCFPHAGGSAATYFSLSAKLSAHARVLAVQYPGRHDRIAEEPLDDLRELATRVTEALLPTLDGPTVLFGHSMGSVLAYEVALRLPPEHLIGLVVSGRVAPSVLHNRGVHLLDDQGIARAIGALSGTPSALLQDEELLAAIIPTLRSDFKAVEVYQDLTGSTLACPISAYCGADDENVPHDGFFLWGAHTTSEFSAEFFPGGHFYLQEQEHRVADALIRDLAAFTAGSLVDAH